MRWFSSRLRYSTRPNSKFRVLLALTRGLVSFNSRSNFMAGTMRQAGRAKTNWVWRTSAALLLAFFTFLVIAPLATNEEIAAASLPACCRIHGKHHCSAQLGSKQKSLPEVAYVAERCPYGPASPVFVHGDTYQPSLRADSFAEGAADPVLPTPSRTKQHRSFDRSLQKRGPPTPFLSA